MEWFERWFGEEYKALYPHRDEAEAVTQVDAVVRAAGALPTWRILDVGCGAGRHLRAFRKFGPTFGQTGLTAFGVDLSAVLLRDARDTGLNVARADMRRLPFQDKTFDLVTCFFTSFGYFDTVEEDMAVLAEFRRLARSGGQLFLDLPNAVHLCRNLVESEVVNLAGRPVEVERRLERDSVVKRLRVDDEYFEERVRLFTPECLEPHLRGLGLETVCIFGDEHGSAFDPQQSPRMSLLLRCP